MFAPRRLSPAAEERESPPAALPEGPQPDAGEQRCSWRAGSASLWSSGARELTVTELRDISGAIDGLADLPAERRTIERCRLPQQYGSRRYRGEAPPVGGGGPLGWVFDNVIEDIGFGDFGGSGKFIGYDMTDFLDNEEIRTPLMAYLFHRVEQMIDGRRIIIVIDEFWKALQDEGFAILRKTS